MAVAGRKRDIAIRVMVTAKEQAEIRKSGEQSSDADVGLCSRQGARGGAGRGMSNVAKRYAHGLP